MKRETADPGQEPRGRPSHSVEYTHPGESQDSTIDYAFFRRIVACHSMGLPFTGLAIHGLTTHAVNQRCASRARWFLHVNLHAFCATWYCYP
jgi:hypothetical protein